MLKWNNLLKKSLNKNIQLEFFSKGTISFINKGNPDSDIFELKNLNINNEYLIYELNLKNDYSNFLFENENISLIHYFPLTKEKYKIKGKIYFYNNKGFVKKELKNFEKNEFNQIWDNLDNERKKEYKEIISNNKKNTINNLEYDIKNYNNPNVENIPDNFCLWVIEPFEIELVLYKMPQVIADKRTTFESEFKKYKQNKKYLFIKNEKDDWKINEVNFN